MSQLSSDVSPKVRYRAVRPKWINSLVKQQSFVLCDASGSMAGQKANDAQRAREEFVAELAQPGNRDGFQVAMIDFHREARLIHELTPATELTGKIAPLTPNGGTNITTAIELAIPLASRVPDDGTFLRPVTILFSDGGHNIGPPPDKAAAELKKFSDLATVAFGSNADEELLRRLATAPQFFHRCQTGAELRAFMAHVGQTIVRSTVIGQNAGDLMAQEQ